MSGEETGGNQMMKEFATSQQRERMDSTELVQKD